MGKEIEKITNRLDVGEVDAHAAPAKTTESSKRRCGKWFKKESSKHPGRFYYVNVETGESSWKRPADFTEAAAAAAAVQPLAIAPPPGLCLQPTVPEDAEMRFDDASLARNHRFLPVAVNCH